MFFPIIKTDGMMHTTDTVAPIANHLLMIRELKLAKI